eukprot:scaffold40359_cov69-Phaeocystis_antarctica.AAC.5
MRGMKERFDCAARLGSNLVSRQSLRANVKSSMTHHSLEQYVVPATTSSVWQPARKTGKQASDCWMLPWSDTTACLAPGVSFSHSKSGSERRSLSPSPPAPCAREAPALLVARRARSCCRRGPRRAAGWRAGSGGASRRVRARRRNRCRRRAPRPPPPPPPRCRARPGAPGGGGCGHG